VKIDLSRDKQKIRKYILRRIKEYPDYVNVGPGEDADPIQAAILGFYAAQGGYIYLVFDTRPGINLDGEWTLHIDDPTMCHFPKWCDFYERACDGKQVALVGEDGNIARIQYSLAQEDDLIDEESEGELNAYFGDMLKNLMTELRDDGSLAALPLAKDAFMVIEEFDGHYFWPQRRSCKTKGRILPKAP
jgi:hypothetical protein